jgi:hypothetical protein
MAWTRRVLFDFPLRQNQTATLIIVSPLTGRVPGIKQLGLEADDVNEWICTSAPPVRCRGVHRDTLAVYIYRLLQTYEQTVNPSTRELNPSAQRCLTRFLLGILLLEPCISLIYA